MNNLTWRQADHDVFVATRDGEYAGFVAVDGTTHVLHDRHSRRLGSYPSLSAARTALESAPAGSVLPAGTGSASARRRRSRTSHDRRPATRSTSRGR
ncbi:hypothetical protein [Microbacterium capsulatum]|uniref:Uncharacterized protein n=1 Tax=Microbacterium capsulatum TaxID=3041921 RepID=A0ABU0XK14_9MICO|nr:hypothetical protein [Microbacterium sp. ASV81]MDQ4215484.1 hypothetical protein [Microbacterium sp. ASV81]